MCACFFRFMIFRNSNTRKTHSLSLKYIIAATFKMTFKPSYFAHLNALHVVQILQATKRWREREKASECAQKIPLLR